MSAPPNGAPLDGPPMDAKLKHLELIQGVVNRLATDSARLKGWSVTLVAALFILLARGGREYIHVAFVPVLAFWGLDGYYLWQERLFRALYDHVRSLEESGIDFSLEVGPFRGHRTRTWLGATFSHNADCLLWRGGSDGWRGHRI